MNALKNAISMPGKTRPLQNSMDFVDGLKGQLPDEELAVIKRHVEKRSREAAQAQVTVTPVDTVQYCSPQTPEPSPDVCVKLENNEGRMDPERGELAPPSAGTGLETPGQQCPPNEGTWEKGRTIADGYSLVGMESTTTAGITFLQQGHKPKGKDKDSEENKQFDPGGKGEKASLWNAAVTLSFFFCGERWAMGRSLLVLCIYFVCALCSFPVCSVL